jgi:hypothetical protein
MSEQNINTLIDHFNLYKQSHPNLVNCWTTYLELKKKNYGTIAASVPALEYNIILNYLKCGEKDYTNEDILRVLIFKTSLLNDSLFNMI